MITLDDLRQDSHYMDRWQRNRFLVLVFGAIVIACLLVFIAMAAYNNSGAAQLDMSRRAYKKVQEQAGRDETAGDQTFPATGALTDKAFADFNTLFTKRTETINSMKAFDSSAMTDDALGLPTAGAAQ